MLLTAREKTDFTAVMIFNTVRGEIVACLFLQLATSKRSFERAYAGAP